MSSTEQVGFVERVVSACERVESSLGRGKTGPATATAIREAVFEDVLGYDAAAASQSGGVVRFAVDGRVAVVLAAAGRGADATAVVEPAFAAAAGTPARFVVAATPSRLLVYERLDGDAAAGDPVGAAESGDAADARAADGDDPVETIRGTPARRRADVSLAETVAAARRGPPSETLDPARQLQLAKLRVLRVDALTDGTHDERGGGEPAVDPADDGGSDSAAGDTETGTAGSDGDTEASAGDGGGPEGAVDDTTPAVTADDTMSETTATTTPETDAEGDALVATALDCLEQELVPAVGRAHETVSAEIDDFEGDREAATTAIEHALASAEPDAAGPARRRLVEVDAAAEPARRLRAAYGSWVRGARRTGFTPGENRRAFVRVTAAALLDDLLLGRALAANGVVPELSAGEGRRRLRETWAASGLDRDASDVIAAAREARRPTVERATPDPADWLLAHAGSETDTGQERVADALAATMDRLADCPFPSSPARIAAAYDDLRRQWDVPAVATGDDPPAVSGTDPTTDTPSFPEAVCDRLWGDEGVRGAAPAVVDPACGDGRYLVAAAARLRERLADASPTARLRAVRGSLTGVDPDPLACRVTETRLWLELLPDLVAATRESSDLALEPLRVFRTDPLAAGHDGRPPAPDALTGRRYDVVLGRFPTVLRRAVPDGPAAAAYADYETAYYTYDLSALYLERVADWLAPGGRLAAVVAGRFRDTRFGEKTRERLPGWYDLAELRELPGSAPGGSPLLVVARRRESTATDPAARRPADGHVTVAAGLDAAGEQLPAAVFDADEWPVGADGDSDG
ncbi:hypothetical protein RYH80_10605 [Halobaculum sp. MBLA0147]|uniref:hypothetical protein n=1 Tax=Halobaculum sp. MBLA0147 TaxID=3079934 RepID=UPI003523DA4A